MHHEQPVLSDQIVHMAKELIHPTPYDDMDPLPGEDLHIGIVSTNMGTGTFTYSGCSSSQMGDQGRLQNIGRLEGCADSYSAGDCGRGQCPWLSHMSAVRTPPIWEDLGCIATLGTE